MATEMLGAGRFSCCIDDCPAPCENAAEGHQIACNGPVCEARDRFMLGANGYVVVPEPLLKELLTAAKVEVDGFNGSCYLRVALAAVVEAVGPTREDQR